MPAVPSTVGIGGAGSGVGGPEGFASHVERAGSWYRHGGHFPKRGRTLKAKPSHQMRCQSLPAYTYCKWQHCHFAVFSYGVFAWEVSGGVTVARPRVL